VEGNDSDKLPSASPTTDTYPKPRLYWIVPSIRRNDSTWSFVRRTVQEIPWLDHKVFTYDERVVEFDAEGVETVLSQCPDHWGRQMASRGAYMAMEVAADIERWEVPVWGVVSLYISWIPIIDAAVNHGLAWGVPIIYLAHGMPGLDVVAESSAKSRFGRFHIEAPWAWAANSMNVHWWLHDNDKDWVEAYKAAAHHEPPNEELEALRIHYFTFDVEAAERAIEAKEDVVLFGGRMNSEKDPATAAEILYLLSDDITKVVTIPNPSTVKREKEAAEVLAQVADELHQPCYPEEYREALRKAKVCLITSTRATQIPGGYREAAEAGALWVVKERPWVIDLIGPDWPLLWKTKDQAVKAVEYAIDHYEELIAEQNRRMAWRFSSQVNWDRLIEAVAIKTAETNGAKESEADSEKIAEGFFRDVNKVRRETGKTGGTRGAWRVAEGLRRLYMKHVDPQPWERIGNFPTIHCRKWETYDRQG